MLTKTPKPGFKRFIGYTIKAALIVEGVGLIATYAFWNKLNSDRDFRLYMYKNHNWLLEGYYGLGEKLGGIQTRDVDEKIWKNEEKI